MTKMRPPKYARISTNPKIALFWWISSVLSMSKSIFVNNCYFCVWGKSVNYLVISGAKSKNVFLSVKKSKHCIKPPYLYVSIVFFYMKLVIFRNFLVEN